MKLGDVAYSRDNNFNLIRLLAAYAVLFSHSFVLVTGKGSDEPFMDTIPYSLAGIAVDIFFVTSGFLITGSLLRRPGFFNYFKARVLRIYPALIVNNAIVVLIVAPLLTTLTLQEYFQHPTPWRYLWENSTLILHGMYHFLPGMFADNPFPDVINGSLWTLTYEMTSYIVIALFWAIAVLIFKSNRKVMGFLVIALTVAALTLFYMSKLGEIKFSQSYRLYFFFFCGASMFMLKDYIALKHSYATIAAILVGITVFLPDYFHFVYTPLLGYLTLYCAYVPGGKVREFNKVGDYSYGVYIYAFITQQSLRYLYPEISIAEMVIYATLIVLPLSMLSWHLIEKKALSFK
jgi:peptidoglycan/LPS O-acetylase OafA/YrhL